MEKNISPVGLKGKKDITNRMSELMGIKNEEVKHTPAHNVKLTKMGPDGKAYGIVKENNKYYIKSATPNDNGLVEEEFQYIGGLENKIKESYNSYSTATKKLQNKFSELNKRNFNPEFSTNILKNDNLLSETYGGVASMGMSELKQNEKGEMEDLYEIEEIEEEIVDENESFIDSKSQEIEESMKRVEELYNSVMGKKKSLK